MTHHPTYWSTWNADVANSQCRRKQYDSSAQSLQAAYTTSQPRQVPPMQMYNVIDVWTETDGGIVSMNWMTRLTHLPLLQRRPTRRLQSALATMHSATCRCLTDRRQMVARWCSGRVSDSQSADCGFDSRPRHYPAATFGKLFTPIVPLFTKQYNLVPCEGFHVDAPFVAAMAWSPMNKGSIVEAVLQCLVALGRVAKNRYINYLLYFTLVRRVPI